MEEGDEEEGAGAAVATASAAELKMSELEAEIVRMKEVNLENTRLREEIEVNLENVTRLREEMLKEVILESTQLREENAQLKLTAEAHGPVIELAAEEDEKEEDAEFSMRPDTESMHDLFTESMHGLFEGTRSGGGGSRAGGEEDEKDDDGIAAGWGQHPVRSGETYTI